MVKKMKPKKVKKRKKERKKNGYRDFQKLRIRLRLIRDGSAEGPVVKSPDDVVGSVKDLTRKVL